jgi:hypothetical protein
MIKRYAIPFSAELMESDLVIDQDEEWLIVTQLPSHLFKDCETLIEIEHPAFTDLFSDYGFISTENRVYLYEELVSAFSIVRGHPPEITMMLLQLEEYMIAQEKKEKEPVYFIGKHHDELLMKVAAAYNVTIHIFDLDKYIKND